MKKVLVVLLIFSPLVAHAEFYKSIDANGNVVYSDEPSPDAELIEAPPDLNIIQMPKYEEEPDEEIEEEKPKYTLFRITSPTIDETIRQNSGNLLLTLELKPGLDKEEGDSISVYIDGVSVIRNTKLLSIAVSSIDRGSHSIHAVIISKKGKTLIKTDSVPFHMKRFSIQHGSSSTADVTDPDATAAISPGPQGVIFKPGPIIVSQPTP